MEQFIFEAIGTHWVLDIFNAISPDVEKSIHARIEQFDQNYSRFRPDSLVSTISRKAGTYTLPDDARPMLDIYQKLYQLTDGAFTPLIGKTLEQAGYDADYSLKPGEMTKPPTWEEAFEYNHPMLKMKQPAILDFGAAGKGYLIDLVAQVLETFGIKNFCIDAGGDILYKNIGDKPLEVGLENPLNTQQAIGIAKITNQSLCGSAGNRRQWKNFHHIIDPRTLKSPENILATWVVADTGLIADGLATCLFLTEPEKFTLHFAFEYLIFYSDSSIKKSSAFPAELFYK